MEGLIIRDMAPADLLDVFRIETEAFSTPWSISSFKHELTERYSILKVAILNDRVVGYICLRTMLDITHVLNLAVTPGYRRRGVASWLLIEALDELSNRQKETDFITLEVRASSPAVKLYEKLGFRVIGRRKGYYHKPLEDATLMGLDVEKAE